MDSRKVASMPDGWAQEKAINEVYRDTSGWAPYKVEVKHGVLAGLVCVSPIGGYRIFQRRAFEGQDWTKQIDSFLSTKRWEADIWKSKKV